MRLILAPNVILLEGHSNTGLSFIRFNSEIQTRPVAAELATGVFRQTDDPWLCILLLPNAGAEPIRAKCRSMILDKHAKVLVLKRMVHCASPQLSTTHPAAVIESWRSG